MSKLQRHQCPTFGALPLGTITRTNWPLHFYIYRLNAQVCWFPPVGIRPAAVLSISGDLYQINFQ
jgi:hypothetical protein